jgi:uncharacterized protein (DUF2267 family)
MKDTVGHIFDSQSQKMYNYINALMYTAQISSPHKAYSILRATLHTLRDCLTIDEIAHLGAELPLIMRGIYYEGWKPSTVPKEIKNLNEFYSNICFESTNAFSINEVEKLAPEVLFILEQHISEGQIRKIKNMLPKNLRTLLPDFQ